MFVYVLFCVFFDLNNVDHMLVTRWFIDSFIYFVIVSVLVYLLCYIVNYWQVYQVFEDVYYNYSFYGDNENMNNDINDADNLTWTWSNPNSDRVDVTTGDVMRANSYNHWNLSYTNRTYTSTVIGNRGNNQSDQFDSSSNVDVGSKCNVDAFSGRNGNKYDRDMHVEVQLQHRVEDEVEPDDYDVGISLDSDVDEEGDTCISSACTSSACESSLDKPVFQLCPMFCSTSIAL